MYYPEPKHDIILEPFAGSACYSLRHPTKRVYLSDLNPTIVYLWNYLLNVSEDEIYSLPEKFKCVGDLKIDGGAKILIGFWLNHGTTSPSKSPSAWMRAGKHKSSFWGPEVKERIASQLKFIRHWELSYGPYDVWGDFTATWFIDPPYQKQGKHYPCNNIDYTQLGIWCSKRKGQVIVCEQEGADWLPFKPFRSLKSTRGQSKEVVWVK